MYWYTDLRWLACSLRDSPHLTGWEFVRAELERHRLSDSDSPCSRAGSAIWGLHCFETLFVTSLGKQTKGLSKEALEETLEEALPFKSFHLLTSSGSMARSSSGRVQHAQRSHHGLQWAPGAARCSAGSASLTLSRATNMTCWLMITRLDMMPQQPNYLQGTKTCILLWPIIIYPSY